MKAYKKGFTLIELLVVIAIIGILAAVVLASLNTARDSANDAAAKVQMSEIRNQAEIYYTSNSSYNSSGTGIQDTSCQGNNAANTILADAQMINLVNSVASSTDNDVNCGVWDGSYAFEVELGNGDFFCVDSSGAAVEGATTITTTDPAAC